MKNKTTLNDQLCEWTQENFDKGIMRFDTCETLDGVRFDSCEILKEERFAPLFEKLSLLKKAKLFDAGDTDYENAVVTAEDISFVLDVDGDNVIFVACDRLFRDGFFSDYSYSAYYWHIDDWGFEQELFSCPYTEYDARKGKDNNFQPVVIPKYITQKSIPAPATNNSFSNFGLNTVDDVLNAQGFTVEQTSGADLGVSFTELMIKTEENGEYYYGVTPLTEKPMTKYTLNFTRDGQTVKVHKCLKISAYTIDSRYGFIYAKDGKITRWDEWIASDKSSISYSGGWGDKEIVSLIVLGDYLLITELCWNCTRRGVENEYMWGGGYTSSHYFANPVLHVYSFNQGKEIKTISSVGVYPEYSVNNKGQYVIKVIHRDKPENPFESKKVKTTTLTLTVLDTAFDWIEKNMKTD